MTAAMQVTVEVAVATTDLVRAHGPGKTEVRALDGMLDQLRQVGT